MASEAIEKLYNEHNVIKSVISNIDKVCSLSKSDPEKYKETMAILIGFFRNYADKFHHYKEEKLLFPLMTERNDSLKDGIISEMLDNHNDFRDMVKAIEQAVNNGNYEDSNSLLIKYTGLLLDHIAVEDDELFQIAETLFDVQELEKLSGDFEDIDRELGVELKNEYEKISEKIT